MSLDLSEGSPGDKEAFIILSLNDAWRHSRSAIIHGHQAAEEIPGISGQKQRIRSSKETRAVHLTVVEALGIGFRCVGSSQMLCGPGLMVEWIEWPGRTRHVKEGVKMRCDGSEPADRRMK
jgi:hypothetical protein